MSVKTILVLAALTVCACIAAAVALSFDRGASLDPRIGQLVLPTLVDRANDVATIAVESRRATMHLDRGPDGWTMRESDGYPVETVKAKGTVLDLVSLRFHEPKTDRPEKYAKLNLLDTTAPKSESIRVIVTAKDGTKLADLLFGSTKFNLPGTKTGGVYIRLPGEKRTWLAAGGVNLGDQPSDWLQTKILDISGDRIKRTEILRKDGPTVVITRRNPKTLVYVLDGLAPGYKLKYENEPKLIATNLEKFELENARRAGAIDFPPDRTVRTIYTTFDGLRVTVETVKRDDGSWSRFRAEATDDATDTVKQEARALSEKLSKWVYRIPSYRASRLTKRFDEMIEPVSK